MVQQRLVPVICFLVFMGGDRSRQLYLSRRACRMVKDGDGNGWLTPKEAAQKLNLSVGRIYQLKAFLTHRKVGSEKQGRVFFLDSALFDDYMNI